MNSQRPDTPPARDPDEVITSSPGPGRAGGWQQTTYGAAGGEAEARVFTWSSAGRSFPWFAVLLVLLGVALLIEFLVPELSFGSLLILAVGGAFAAAWLVGHIVGATVPALIFIAWALSRMATELGILAGDGWSSLFVGGAFLIGWGLARFQRARREWALWLGIILGVIGLADVTDALPFSLDFAIVIPLAIIAVGVYLIYRNRVAFQGLRYEE